MQSSHEINTVLVSNDETIGSIASSFGDFALKLEQFDPVAALKKVSGLSLFSKYSRQQQRIELLIHVVALYCRGSKKPSTKRCIEWYNELAEIDGAFFEDEAEDGAVRQKRTSLQNPGVSYTQAAS